MRLCRTVLFIVLLSAVPKVSAVEAPAAIGGAISMPLSAGAMQPSDVVKGLQRELKRAGYDPGIEDGKMGPATKYALKRFQDDQGLTITGEPDIPTLIKLLEQSLQR